MSGDWRDSYAHGMLAIWPPDAVRAVVNPLRERYDPVSAAACEAHITLTQPFVCAPSDVDLAVINDILRRVAPLEVSYGPLDTFLPYPVIYLAIAPRAPLTALHDALQATGLFHPDPAHYERFVPHMTILEGTLSPDDTSRLADELRGTTPEGTFVCRDIAHVVPDGSFRFKVVRRFALDGSLQRRR